MKAYAKIINNETKEVKVGVGCSVDYYIEIGMTPMDIEKAYNDRWYVEGYAPVKPTPPPPTKEEVSERRREYRREMIDDKTAQRSRKMANGSWTQEDEQAYLELDAEITAYIEEHFPYPQE